MSVAKPRHIAIVMDGNGRWANQQNKSRLVGHKAGADALEKVIQAAIANKIEILSVFAFSTENWNRPKEEVKGLLKLFSQAFKKYTKDLTKKNISLRVIGDTSKFPKSLQKQIQKAETISENNTGLKFVIAANYGGKWDIQQAVEKSKGKNFEKYLMLADLPPVDLFIRTSGEMRISNFFLWQLAYAELYFTKVFWPDFNEKEFQKALEFYAKRERRYGKINP